MLQTRRLVNLFARFRLPLPIPARLAVVLLASSGFLLAQISGDLAVQVKDSSGAALPSATVTIRNATTGAARTAKTDSTGSARFTELGIGDYSVKAEASGFTSIETKAAVKSGDVVPVDLTMGVQSSQTVVSVTEASENLNTVNAQLQTTTESKGIENLPIGSGGPLMLAAITPGVTPVTPRNPFLGLGSFNSNGGRGRGNNITLDGANATDVSTTGASGLGTVPMDAVAEFNIITNNFQAQYGRNADAQVQLITKSGTNDFHGDLFEFFANDKLNARDYFDKTGSATPIRNNDWGAVAGGPIIKNKLFVFGTYEQQKIRGAGATRTAIVPTPAEVNGNIDPTAAKLLQLLQVPTSPTGSVSNPAPNLSNSYAYSARVDWNITDNDVFYTRFGTSNSTVESPGLTFIDSNLPNNGASSTNTPYNATMSETHSFSSSVVNQVLFAFGRSAPVFQPLSTSGGPEIQFLDGTSNFGISNILPQGSHPEHLQPI